jgi:negative regulator of genetic competence, sporulation and motility
VKYLAFGKENRKGNERKKKKKKKKEKTIEYTLAFHQISSFLSLHHNIPESFFHASHQLELGLFSLTFF